MDYCIAGHPPILHYHANDRSVVRLNAEDIPLGVLDDRHFSAGTQPCSPGDMFVVLTDGIFEVENDEGAQLGLDRVEQAMRDLVDRPLGDACAKVFEVAHQHGRQADDQTLLLVRVL